MNYDVIVIGGGAAGFFGAINCAEANPSLRIAVLERTRQVLSKVKISGGGRCNVTHACFDERELVKHYPRGNKELLGPFTRFKTADTIEWFKQKGVALKVEEDGRMFPVTDSSSTIIDCFSTTLKRLKIDLVLGCDATRIEKKDDVFVIAAGEQTLQARYIILATGSHPKGLELAASLGHTLVPPVPSLFTFNIPDSPFLDLAGISVNPVEIVIKGTSLKQTGPLLLTHWGFSGPAVLKLSAWGARILNEMNYQAEIAIDWLPNQSLDELDLRKPKPVLEEFLPKNLAKRILSILNLGETLSNKQLNLLKNFLKSSSFNINGKTTYKQEFVTAGGIQLKEVNFKTLESLLVPNLYFAGEVLNIDGVTGGFNFQNAWTTSWLAAKAIAEKT